MTFRRMNDRTQSLDPPVGELNPILHNDVGHDAKYRRCRGKQHCQVNGFQYRYTTMANATNTEVHRRLRNGKPEEGSWQ